MPRMTKKVLPTSPNELAVPLASDLVSYSVRFVKAPDGSSHWLHIARFRRFDADGNPQKLNGSGSFQLRAKTPGVNFGRILHAAIQSQITNANAGLED